MMMIPFTRHCDGSGLPIRLVWITYSRGRRQVPLSRDLGENSRRRLDARQQPVVFDRDALAYLVTIAALAKEGGALDDARLGER